MAILRARWREYNEQRTRRPSARSAERDGGGGGDRPSLRAHDGLRGAQRAHPVRHDRAARASQGRHARLGGRRRDAAPRGRGGDPRPRRGVLDRGASSRSTPRRGRLVDAADRHPADGRRHGADGGRGARAARPRLPGGDGAPRHHRLRRASRSTPGRPGTSASPTTTAGGSSRCVAFVKPHPGDNEWAHPIDGVIAFVDLNRLEVLRVDDHGVVPIPPESGNFDVAAGAPLRDDIAPLEITQPDGPGFALDGPRAVVAALAGARRLHAARGPRAQPARLRRRRAAALDPVSRLALRDGRALRRSQPEPLLEERLRRRRERRRRGRVAAHARLRLPGRDRLPRRASSRTPRASRARSRTRSASTRRTPACSGGTSSGATARARCAARAGS